MPECSMTLDADGSHRLGGSLPAVCRDTRFYVEATINRVINDPIAVTVWVPGKISRIDINGLHVSLAHSHVETLLETARLMGVKVGRRVDSVLGVLKG